MKTALPLMLLLALCACDRRDHPDAPGASPSVGAAQGAQTGETRDEAAADDAAVATPTAPDTTSPSTFEQVPPTATQCEGKVGDELAECLKNTDQQNVGAPTTP